MARVAASQRWAAACLPLPDWGLSVTLLSEKTAAVSCMAFVFPGSIALSTQWPGQGGSGGGERSRWDRVLWVLGWVLLVVGLLQGVASITSQFV